MFGDSGPPVGIDAGIAHIDDFLRRPTTRLLITLVAEAVEPDSPVRSFYAELHGTMRKWTADWVDTMTLPPGVSRGDHVTILLGTTLVSIFDAGCDGAPGTLMYPISLSRL
jgi:TetR/AcrR family acrAB operon transcriptional repressor